MYMNMPNGQLFANQRDICIIIPTVMFECLYHVLFFIFDPELGTL